VIDVTDDHDSHPRLDLGGIVDALKGVLLHLGVEGKPFLVEADRT
jgi:hypothetical protein